MSALRDIRIYIADSLKGSSIPSLLGPVSAANARIYSAWPQHVPRLTSGTAMEGWLVFNLPSTNIPDTREGIGEDVTVEFNVWASQLTLIDDVLDVLDTLYHFRKSGRNGILIGDNLNVTYSTRTITNDLYEDETNLYRRRIQYLLRTVKTPFAIGA